MYSYSIFVILSPYTQSLPFSLDLYYYFCSSGITLNFEAQVFSSGSLTRLFFTSSFLLRNPVYLPPGQNFLSDRIHFPSTPHTLHTFGPLLSQSSSSDTIWPYFILILRFILLFPLKRYHMSGSKDTSINLTRDVFLGTDLPTPFRR